jgi:polyisoprenoid-binding protein YceI
MNNKISAIALTIVLAATSMWASPTGSEENNSNAMGPAYSYNSTESKVYWEGSKPGGTHVGTIEVVNGKVITDGNQIVGGTFNLDMATIQNEDIKNDGMRSRLLEHLRSEDFFHVEKYPVSTFEITGVEPSDSGPSTHVITGNLTIRGNTREISFPAEIDMSDRLIHARSGEITLNRTLWGVNYNSKSIFAGLKDSFIDDEMVITLDVHLDRN